MKNQLLIIFVKNPELGKAKTRLAATIGDESALEVYKRLLNRTRDITQDVNADKVVFYNQFVDDQDLWHNDVYEKKLQIQGNLGEKMLNAFEWAFSSGYEQVCIIGSDCYDLTTEIIDGAFTSLQTNQAVIGPSEDGGYYLIGMSKFLPQVFKNKEWSTETVFSETIKDFEEGALSFETLTTLNDIDTEEDLGDWASDLNPNT